MRLRELSISVATIMALTAAPARAASPKAGGPKGGPKTTVAPKSHGAQSATHGGPKTTTASSPKTTTHGSPKHSTTTTTTATNPKATTPSATATPAPEPLNPIASKISSNKGLSPKMATLLPKNMTLNEASKGFKNQGQFIAALHVSQNLGIPFADLKTAMTGITPKLTTAPKTGGTSTGTSTTGTSTTSNTTTSTTTTQPTLLSLGQAIKKLRGGVDADAAATTATQQATADLGSK